MAEQGNRSPRGLCPNPGLISDLATRSSAGYGSGAPLGCFRRFLVVQIGAERKRAQLRGLAQHYESKYCRAKEEAYVLVSAGPRAPGLPAGGGVERGLLMG